jgi:hypothetical protein
MAQMISDRQTIVFELYQCPTVEQLAIYFRIWVRLLLRAIKLSKSNLLAILESTHQQQFLGNMLPH